MTPTLFKRATYGIIILTLAFVVGFDGQMKDKSNPATTPGSVPSASPTPTPILQPTKQRYSCDERREGDLVTFAWTRRMPQNGWLGTVSYGSINAKPIQVFDAKSVAGGTSWAFQAQDGSFQCRMFVSSNPLQRNLSVGGCNNNNFPQLDCSLLGDGDAEEP